MHGDGGSKEPWRLWPNFHFFFSIFSDNSSANYLFSDFSSKLLGFPDEVGILHIGRGGIHTQRGTLWLQA